MNTQLVKIDKADGKDIYEMLQTISKNENEFKNPVNGMSYEKYKDWLIEQVNWSNEIGLPNGYVGQTIFWLYDGVIPVGMGKIRHELTDISRIAGGNIGYAIASKYRGKGYGTVLLTLLREKSIEMGIDERLLTVEKYNPVSKAVIEKCGGKLIKENEKRWFLSL